MFQKFHMKFHMKFHEVSLGIFECEVSHHYLRGAKEYPKREAAVARSPNHKHETIKSSVTVSCF